MQILKKTKLEALKEKATIGKRDIIPDYIKNQNLRLDLYLQRLGWTTDYDISRDTLTITNPRIQWKN